MKLKSLAKLYFAVLGGLLSATAVVAIAKSDNERELIKSQELRYESYLKADELRQSSDDLTRLARTYVLTGDNRYETQYWNLLAIRQGEKPRPQNYERIYWDFMAVGDKPRADGETIALTELMRKLGFSDPEFAKLDEAQVNSEGLMRIETVAMNAVKGLFDDGDGGFTRTGQPDLAMARELMHSPEYHQYKADIMKPMDEFFVLLDERTANSIEYFADKAAGYLSTIIVLLSLTVLMFVLGLCSFQFRVIRPVGRLEKALEAIARNQGDDITHLDVTTNDEISAVAVQFNRTAEKFSSVIDSVKSENKSATRIRQALDASSSCIVIGNENDKIIYVNHVAEQAINAFESSFQRYAPQFSASQIYEAHHSDLHPDTKGRGILQNLDAPHEESVEIDGFTFNLKASPITDNTGERLGVITEWHDITKDIEAERLATAAVALELDQAQILNRKADDILDVLNSAMQGDLSRSINMEGEEIIDRMGRGVQALLNELRSTLTQIGHSATALNVSSESLATTSHEIGSVASKASNDLSSVTSTSDLMNKDVEQVANAVEQMSSAIRHIASNASEAAQVASNAVNIAETTDTTMRQLSASSNDIGNVLKVITSIAEQTNLLALNATIEAARAGDAGKGFAVVANEVKELAKETAKATDDISNRIEAIQSDSGNAVDAIGVIKETIDKINYIQTSIADAVEEQTATTNEIANTMQSTVLNSGTIANDIGGVATGMHQTEQSVSNLQSSATEIATLADELNQRLERFDINISS